MTGLKYMVIIGDGMADHPLEELGGKTPLQVADKPNMDRIASDGSVGLLRNVPAGMEPNSDVAIMSIMGYNPQNCYTGRGPLEAAGMDIELKENDLAFRCNLITLENGLIEDYSADHVTTEEAEELIGAVEEEYGTLGDFYVGLGYRHLFVLRNSDEGVDELVSTPPHHVVGEKLRNHLIEPRSVEVAKSLNEIILSSRGTLSNHPINEKRRRRGRKPANSIWLWGQGKKPALEPFDKKYGISGAVISAVMVVKGLGVCAGMDEIDVPGATGYYDTSYENKAKYGLEALGGHDLVLIHVEAPDEAGHAGDVEKKIEAIENLDRRLIKKVMEGVEDQFTISIVVDHPTPIDVRDHTSEPVPFAVFSSEGTSDDVRCYDELSAKRGSKGIIRGYKLFDELIL